MAGKLEYYNGTAWAKVGTVTSINGTTSQITITGTTTDPVIAIATDPIIPGTGATTITVGTTAQRPATPTVGMMRFNTDLTDLT